MDSVQVAHTDIFRQGFIAENGSYKGDHAAVLFDLKAKDKLYFLGGGCEPTTAATGSLVYHVCGWRDCAPFSPDIYRMNPADVGSRSSHQAEMAAPESDWGHEYFPRISTDGRWLSYGASTGCHALDQCDYEVFIHRLEEGVTSRTRITADGGNDQWPHMFVGKLWHEEPGPRLLVTPSSWHVVLTPGEAHPRLPTALLKNSGGGSLADAEVEVLYHDAAGWLSVARRGSGNEQEIELALGQPRLNEGRYRATLTVRVDGAASSPQRLPILIEHGGDDPEAPSGCSMISNEPQSPPTLVLALAIGLASLWYQCRRRAGRSQRARPPRRPRARAHRAAARAEAQRRPGRAQAPPRRAEAPARRLVLDRSGTHPQARPPDPPRPRHPPASPASEPVEGTPETMAPA